VAAAFAVTLLAGTWAIVRFIVEPTAHTPPEPHTELAAVTGRREDNQTLERPVHRTHLAAVYLGVGLHRWIRHWC
jgi:hypothetical protein